jgi:aminodeoxyfutalosine deaminase
MSELRLRVIRAPWILPGEGPALSDGAVVVRGGEIVDVGRASDVLPRHAGTPVQALDGVLGPGLVNAHTHLELTALAGKVQGGRGFVPWLEWMIGMRASEQPELDEASVSAGVSEIERTGTVAVGEVTNTLAAVRELERRNVAGIVFVELFARDPVRALEGAEKIRQDLVGRPAAGDLVFSPAPHTVYTTHPLAVRALLRDARERGTRSTVHLAEHPAERTYLRTGDGPFAAFVRQRQGEAPPLCPGKGPIDLAEELGLVAPDVLLVHLTDARPDEIRRVADHGAPVVLCPRSNLYIEGTLPPLLAILDAGIVPALGTDSLASNRSLDVLCEARVFAERFPTVAYRTIFEMATAAGARALGRSDLGRIAKGARPGVLLFECDGGDDPFAAVLTAPPRRIVAPRTEVP